MFKIFECPKRFLRPLQNEIDLEKGFLNRFWQSNECLKNRENVGQILECPKRSLRALQNKIYIEK